MGSVCYASVTSNYLTSSVDKPHKSFLKRDKNHDSVKAVRERERERGRGRERERERGRESESERERDQITRPKIGRNCYLFPYVFSTMKIRHCWLLLHFQEVMPTVWEIAEECVINLGESKVYIVSPAHTYEMRVAQFISLM